MPINRILTDIDRKKYKPLIAKMTKLCPEMMSRKIPRSNVQQAFIVEIVLKLLKKNSDSRILCVGSFEDTASCYLGKLGISIVNIDSQENMDVQIFHSTAPEKFDIIFATSVMEHAANDEAFLSYFADLLKEKGTGIITCDFNNDYTQGMPVPATVVRQLTEHDLTTRLPEVLKRYKCKVIGKPNWEGENDFLYQGHTYSFATFVFRKK